MSGEGEGSTESRGQPDKEGPRQWTSGVEDGGEEACPLGKVSDAVPRASLGSAPEPGGHWGQRLPEEQGN